MRTDGVSQNQTEPWSPRLLDLPLSPGASHQLRLAAIPAAAQLVLVQAHVQRGSVSLQQPAADGSGPERVTARHVGLVTRLQGAQTAAEITVTNEGPRNGTVLVVVTLLPDYSELGVCSMCQTLHCSVL